MLKQEYLELKKEYLNTKQKFEGILLEGQYFSGEDKVLISAAILAILLQKSGGQSPNAIDLTSLNLNKKIQALLEDVIEKEWSVIAHLTKNFTKEQLTAFVLHKECEDSAPTFKVFNPLIDLSQKSFSLQCLAKQLLNINGGDTVLDLGSGANSFLFDVGLDYPTATLKGVEINKEFATIAKLREILLPVSTVVRVGNALNQYNRSSNEVEYNMAEPLEADRIFSFPPVGLRANKLDKAMDINLDIDWITSLPKTATIDWAFAYAAHQHLTQNENSKAVVLTSVGSSWNNSEDQVRRRMIEKKMIEKIILLPENLVDGIQGQLLLLVLSHNNDTIRMVDATECFSISDRKNILSEDDINNIMQHCEEDSDCSCVVPYSDIKWNNFILNPMRYIKAPIHIPNATELKSICTIQRGISLSAEKLNELSTEEKTPYQYINLKHVINNEIEKDLPHLTNIEDKLEKFCLTNNQIVLSRMAPFKVCFVQIKPEQKILATGNFYLLNVDPEKANPLFIKSFIESELGMLQLERFAKGATMKAISIEDLQQISIPLLALEEQNRIAEKYSDLKEQEQILKEQIQRVYDKRSKLMQDEL